MRWLIQQNLLSTLRPEEDKPPFVPGSGTMSNSDQMPQEVESKVLLGRLPYMRKHYLHIVAYSCDKCGGPVISGSTAVRDNEISRETEIRQVGAICLSCAHRQTESGAPRETRNFPPVPWDAPKLIEPEHLVRAYFEDVSGKDLH